jgi:hypothetical protein
MKKQILFTAILGITWLLSCSFANAQANKAIRADVQFDFYVGDTKMAAGEYIIEQMRPQSNKTILSVRRKDGKGGTVMIMTDPILTARKGDSGLLFNRYREDYYLSEIRHPSVELGWKLRPGEIEIKLAREFRQRRREAVSRRKSPGGQKGETATDSLN